MFIQIRLDVLCLVTPKPNSEGRMYTHLYSDYLYKDQCMLLFGVFVFCCFGDRGPTCQHQST